MRPHRPFDGKLTAALSYGVIVLAIGFIAYIIWWL